MRFPRLSSILAAVAMIGVAVAAPRATAQEAPVLVACEAIPSGPLAPPELAHATYAEAEAVARQVASHLAGPALRAVGIAPERLDIQVAPGGAFNETVPMLQLRGTLDEAETARAAAALGYVLRQFAVLTADFRDTEAGTAFALVGMRTRVTPVLGQHFFAHAGQVTEGLGTSYVASGDEMLFLNLRDPDGGLLTGLDDDNFLQALGDAVASFPNGTATLRRTGTAAAAFLVNDWTASPNGEEFLEQMGRTGANTLAELAALRARHDAVLRDALERHRPR